MRLFQFCERYEGEIVAGLKAPKDAMAIAEAEGFAPLHVHRMKASGGVSRFVARLHFFCQCWRLERAVSRGAYVFVQSSQKILASRLGVRLLERLHELRGVKLILLVHDVNQLRGTSCASERSLFARFVAVSDVIIVHNRKMMQWFCDTGVSRHKLVSLDCFDYLSENRRISREPFDRVVSFAGNLGLWGLRPFIKQLKNVHDVRWELYGPGFVEEAIGGPNIRYNGNFCPSEVVERLGKGFGLIWDGDSADTCSGVWGNYLRYINPHKLSLYLAAGLPVVIWSGAAQADFVEKNGIGFTVSSLHDIGRRLAEITPERYEKFKDNVSMLSMRVRTGCYLKKALGSAVSRLEGTLED